MQLSSEVTLPRHYVPKFPAKCIVCHGAPDTSVKIAYSSQSPFLTFFIPILWLFGWSRMEVPICKACKPRFRLQRWGRETLCWVIGLAAILWIAPRLKHLRPLTSYLLMALLVVVIVVVYALGEVIWPRIFDTTARKDSIDYEFASPHYAAEFLALNESHVVKSDFI